MKSVFKCRLNEKLNPFLTSYYSDKRIQREKERKKRKKERKKKKQSTITHLMKFVFTCSLNHKLNHLMCHDK